MGVILDRSSPLIVHRARNCNSKEVLWERIFALFLHVARVTAAMATKFGSKSASKLPNSTATILTARLVHEHRDVYNFFQLFSVRTSMCTNFSNIFKFQTVIWLQRLVRIASNLEYWHLRAYALISNSKKVTNRKLIFWPQEGGVPPFKGAAYT